MSKILKFNKKKIKICKHLIRETWMLGDDCVYQQTKNMMHLIRENLILGVDCVYKK